MHVARQVNGETKIGPGWKHERAPARSRRAWARTDMWARRAPASARPSHTELSRTALTGRDVREQPVL